ncbi:MAG: hypothetical protein AAF289_19250 [Cyanobacteria bacterium P01_A01_bin.135]
MNQLDILILVIYTITVILVLKKAIASVDQVTTIDIDTSDMQAMLEENDLADKLKVGFALPNRTPLGKQPTTITVVIANQLDRAVFVDWDRSTFNDTKGRSRRVIRLSPYRGAETISSQVFSPIPPGQTLQEKITAEDTLVRDGDSIKAQKPLVAIKKLDVNESITFSLWLVIRLAETDTKDDRIHILPSEFKVTRCPWTDSLPF